MTMQLELDLAGPPWARDRFPDLGRLRDLDLRPAVFYYCVRELGAGRPCPPGLRPEQRVYVDWWRR